MPSSGSADIAVYTTGRPPGGCSTGEFAAACLARVLSDPRSTRSCDVMQTALLLEVTPLEDDVHHEPGDVPPQGTFVREMIDGTSTIGFLSFRTPVGSTLRPSFPHRRSSGVLPFVQIASASCPTMRLPIDSGDHPSYLATAPQIASIDEICSGVASTRPLVAAAIP